MSDCDKIANLEKVIAKKDSEIAQLVSVINSECNKCGDCAKFGSDCNAGDIDGNENCRACKKFVSKEVAALRALVGELADAMEETCVPDSCRNCETEYKDCTSDCPNRKRRALVSRAREAIGGEK